MDTKEIIVITSSVILAIFIIGVYIPFILNMLQYVDMCDKLFPPQNITTYDYNIHCKQYPDSYRNYTGDSK